MKELSLEKLELIEGGSEGASYVDAFCAGFGAVAVFTGVGGPIAVGCAGWALYRLAS